MNIHTASFWRVPCDVQRILHPRPETRLPEKLIRFMNLYTAVGTGAGELKMLAPALLLLLELCQHSDAAIAEAAAVCTARIASLHPSEAAGLLLCDDGINNLCELPCPSGSKIGSWIAARAAHVAHLNRFYIIWRA